MALRESEIAVKAVDQNFERVLKGFEMSLLGRIFCRAHFRLCFQAKFPQVGQQMPKNLQPIALREAIELKHDRRIKRRDVAMPDVARHAGEKDVGVTALERLWQRQLGDGMSLPKIFAQKQTID